MFPNAIKALPIENEEIIVINSGTTREKLEVYNRVYNQNIQMCDCPDLHKNIADDLIIALQFQNMTRVTVDNEEEEEEIIKPKLKVKKNDKSNK